MYEHIVLHPNDYGDDIPFNGRRGSRWHIPRLSTTLADNPGLGSMIRSFEIGLNAIGRVKDHESAILLTRMTSLKRFRLSRRIIFLPNGEKGGVCTPSCTRNPGKPRSQQRLLLLPWSPRYYRPLPFHCTLLRHLCIHSTCFPGNHWSELEFAAMLRAILPISLQRLDVRCRSHSQSWTPADFPDSQPLMERVQKMIDQFDCCITVFHRQCLQMVAKVLLIGGGPNCNSREKLGRLDGTDCKYGDGLTLRIPQGAL